MSPPCRALFAAALLGDCCCAAKENRQGGCMRRTAVTLPLMAALCWLQPASLAAQTYPSKPIRVITTSSAGGLSDIYIRVVGEELQKRWGQPIVVENRAGGQFNIGAKACADAAADGYTICIMPTDVL